MLNYDDQIAIMVIASALYDQEVILGESTMTVRNPSLKGAGFAATDWMVKSLRTKLRDELELLQADLQAGERLIIGPKHAARITSDGESQVIWRKR